MYVSSLKCDFGVVDKIETVEHDFSLLIKLTFDSLCTMESSAQYSLASLRWILNSNLKWVC